MLDVNTLKNCRALRYSRPDVRDDSSLAALACVETPNASLCWQLRDVRALSKSVSLHELDLSYTNEDNAGIAGLERIATLTPLHFLRMQMHHQRDEDPPQDVLAGTPQAYTALANLLKQPHAEGRNTSRCRGSRSTIWPLHSPPLASGASAAP
jgi:hypothetical protein